MLNIAHRGSSGAFPENTIAAFLAAANEGAQMCELDVAATRDGAVVVIHDDTVDRTTNGTGPVANFTLKKIQRLDAGAMTVIMDTGPPPPPNETMKFCPP